MISIVEPLFHGIGGSSRHLVKTIDFSENALPHSEFLQLVGVGCPSVVVGGDDEILCTIGTVAEPLLHAGLIVDDRQLVVVHQFSC